MDLQKKFRFGVFALAAVALVLTVGPVSAQQQLYHGTFELPFEAQLGKYVLEPGQYSVSLEESFGQKIFRIRGSELMSVLATPPDLGKYSDNNKLVFSNTGGVYSLEKFDIGVIGQAYSFPVSKNKGDRAVASGKATKAVAVVDVH